MPLTLQIRDTVCPADRDHVRKIVASTAMFTPMEIDVSVELVDERLAKGPASGYWFLFAEQDAVPIGYACYGPIACTHSSYDLFWIAVESSAQSLGVGRMLLMESERRVQEQGGTRLYVETSGRAQYLATRVFYERNGYIHDATLRDFYAPGDDKFVYVKVL